MLSILKPYIEVLKKKGRFEICLPAIVILLFLSSEFLSKVLHYNNFNFYRVSAVVKFGFEVWAVIYIILYKKENLKQLIKVSLIFSLIYISGHFFLDKSGFVSRVINNLYSLNGYLFVFILYALFKANSPKQVLILKEQLKVLELIFILIITLNTLAIILGYCFDIHAFETYKYARFGYNGLFYKSSHSSYVYVIFMIYFINKLLHQYHKLYALMLLCLLVSSLFIGTKTVYFFNIFILLFLMYNYLKPKIYIPIITAVLLGGLLFKNNLIKFLSTRFDALTRLYHEEGFISMFMSSRDKLFTEVFIPYIQDYWTYGNYLFGGAEFNIDRAETEPFDLLWFFGIAGTLLYLYYFKKMWKNLKMKKKLIALFIVFAMSIVLSGNFFTNIPVLPYFVILLFSINFHNEELTQN